MNRTDARAPVGSPRRHPAAPWTGAAAVAVLALAVQHPPSPPAARAADAIAVERWGGAVTGVDAAGGTAAVTIGSRLAIVDVGDVAGQGPRLVSQSAPVDDVLSHPHLAGGHAVALGASRGLFVFDVRDPAAPVEVARAATLGLATDLALRDRRALLCDSKGGLRVFDLGADGRPVEWGRWLPPDGREVVSAAPFGDFRAVALVEDDPAQLVVLGLAGDAPEEMGRTALSMSGARDVVVDGDTAFVAFGDGITAVDLRDPAAPAVIDGDRADTGTVDALAAAGGILWAAGTDHVWILDVRSPEAPTIEGVFEVENLRIGLDVDGARAYLADAAGLRVVDVGDVTAEPVIRREAPSDDGVAIGHEPRDAAWVDGAVVVASGAAGLRVLDATHPTTATVIAQLPPADEAHFAASTDFVTVVGDRAYTAEGRLGAGVRVIDLADPSQPRALGEVAAPGVAGRPAVAGDRVAVPTIGDGGGGVRLYEVGTAGVPEARGSLAIGGPIDAAAFDGPTLYLGGFGQLAVVDAADLAAPRLLGRLDGVDASGGIAVVAPGQVAIGDPNFGLVVVDARDPTHPAAVGRFAMAGGASGIERHGDALWAANNYAGVSRLAIDASGTLRVTGRWLVDQAAFDVAAGDDAVWIVSTEEGLIAVAPDAVTSAHEIAMLSAPGYLAQVALDGGRIGVLTGLAVDRRQLHGLDTEPALTPRSGGALGIVADGTLPGDDLALAGDLAWVPGGIHGVVGFDVGRPGPPRRVSAAVVPAAPRDPPAIEALAVAGTTAYGVTLDDLVLFDVADPVQPAVVGRHRLDRGFALAVDDRTAWVLAQGDDGEALVGVDVAAPAALVEVGRWPVPGANHAVAASDGQLVIAADDGLRVWDVRRPSAAYERAVVPFDGAVEAVAVDGGLAWVAEAFGGGYRIHAVDLGTGDTPTVRANVEAPDGWAIDLAAEGRRAAVANGHGGLLALRYDGPLAPPPTPEGSATPPRYTAYLPVAVVQRATAHAVVAVDRSAAMARRSIPGEPAPLDLARDVAGALADRLLRTTAAVAVIAYGQQAERLPSLGPAVVAEALGRLRIDAAVADARHDVMLAAAAATLPEGALAPGCAAVIVITAGAVPSADIGAVAQRRADALRVRGAEIAVTTVGSASARSPWWADLAGGDDRVRPAAGAADAAAIADPLAARLAACR